MAGMGIRIWRSPDTRFGVLTRELDDGRNETMTANAVYPDAELACIAGSGFNAIWVHGLLRNLVKSTIFPEFGRRSPQHLSNLRELIARAAKHSVKVFIYMQPPRAIWRDATFWRHHAEVGGAIEEIQDETGALLPMRSLCTSTDPVRRFLFESSATLTRELPGLGGLILITASEYPSHCWARRGNICDARGHYSDFNPTPCPRCATRKPGDIVTEIIRQVRNGVKRVNLGVEIIAWNWSWNAYEKDPSSGIVQALPADVIYLADFERGSRKQILGKLRPIDEYSLSFVGPSRRFAASTAAARAAGLRVMAKLQLGTTHELATVANLPLIANLHDKAKYLRANKICGFMGCWNFGNRISANPAAFNYFLADGGPQTRPAALAAFAADYFPGCDAPRVATAWQAFSAAMDHYPFSIPFLYSSPINYTLVQPLRPALANAVPCGRSWLMDHRGDSLADSLSPYTLAEVITGLGRLHRAWNQGVTQLRQALAGSSSPHAAAELDNAQVCGHVFRSAWNTYRCWQLTRRWTPGKMDAFRRIARDEVANLSAVLPVLKRDPRQGFHGEAFEHMFTPELVARKIRALKRYAK